MQFLLGRVNRCSVASAGGIYSLPGWYDGLGVTGGRYSLPGGE